MRGTHSIIEVVIGLTALFSVAPLTGCAGQRAAFEKQVAALEDEVTVLQNANDRLEERIAALELSQAARPAPPPEDSVAKASKPELEVVKLAPKAEPAGESDAAEGEKGKRPAPNSEEPARPLIHGTGDRLETTIPEEPTSFLQRFEGACDAKLEHTRHAAAWGPYCGRAET